MADMCVYLPVDEILQQINKIKDRLLSPKVDPTTSNNSNNSSKTIAGPPSYLQQKNSTAMSMISMCLTPIHNETLEVTSDLNSTAAVDDGIIIKKERN